MPRRSALAASARQRSVSASWIPFSTTGIGRIAAGVRAADIGAGVLVGIIGTVIRVAIGGTARAATGATGRTGIAAGTRTAHVG